ncbi:hypothetical protein I5K96_09740 [Serratia marcescens]|nr:hypothetical protein [Serratia marcescens]
MTTSFFTLESTSNKIKKAISELARMIPENEYERSRIEYINLILSSFISEAKSWDESSQFNIENIGHNLLDELAGKELSNLEMDSITSDCFRFFIERCLSTKENPSTKFMNFREFIIDNKGRLSSIAARQVSYALNVMPFDIFQERYNSESLTLVNSFLKAHAENNQNIEIWRAELDERKKEVEKLKESLDEQKNAFNFVGLYKGFDELGITKDKERKTATRILLALGGLIPLPIFIELWFILFKSNTLTLTHSLITLIPSTSLVLILIYYFRIALHDYKSIKTQINQIELRKSLCKFIQNYAQYSSAIKKDDKSALEKFETIIFSNIAMTDEKLPSTFDGIESIASLIKSAKS